ncbi:MAG TPA: bifunctional methylenetetrahydrofolate dehydrogenase/methenyltetrahydrofolate cyclohydrolase FolD [Candidatus Hydrogenedentes bacterium]|nr:bifunctional methylenetetrahydrofolate dehydrogenase/methenyltetrahydrofolate cyclohydrolase FolD [Candidatus Hydrogenedentota bacterium]HQH54158.1 bifunctional methylenetetrahydrofolate dehydrogenase/methenyltetrahydrofolate cyclohydrolase FolD [Candidatus Hydrogenedentota bacterium]HQM50540.1 bifunctional methylenetetrahydrofolate dehydrogenase/methenyltetrahydrofolate cyclohydrolase FolD [Candidatus Hydrogenedentota bacterium]
MPKTAKLIDGKKIAAQIRAEVKTEVDALKKKGITPGLAVVIVGDDPASHVYVRGKARACEELGMNSFVHQLPANATERRVLNLVRKLNEDPKVHAFLVQSPLPKHMDENKVVTAIDPEKDADGFHPVNVGKLLIGEPAMMPCTPHGCQELLNRTGNSPEGKHVVIVGRSNIVGKPLAALLIQKAKGANATVTICHSRTRKLASITKQADILVAAMGVPEFIKGHMIKDGAVVIDVGVNRVEDAASPKGYRLVGDVDFKAACRKARAITPVPGGVGPMTIAMLMKNAVLAAKRAAE